MVFEQDTPRIDHIKCENMPKGLNEDLYIFIYRKQYACVRHEVFKIMIDNVIY
jgi:hypothetical protein